MKSEKCSCGCGQNGHDFHHCLFSRNKRYVILNCQENYAFVNHYEHIARKFDNLKWRKFFWKQKCKEYGEQHMLEWIAEVKATTKLHKSRFDFVDWRE